MIRESLDDDGVLQAVLDKPPVNALGLDEITCLTGLFGGIAERDDVHVVHLRGDGPGFCGGGDVKEVMALPEHEGSLRHVRGTYALTLAMADCAVPIVAEIHGYCVGLGVLLAGVADVVVASEGTKFVLAEIDNGATSGAIQSIGLLPEKRLRIALFTGEPFTAEECAAHGTVRCVASDQLRASASELATTIACKDPEIVRAMKRSTDAAIGRAFREAYRAELSWTLELNLSGATRRARSRRYGPD